MNDRIKFIVNVKGRDKSVPVKNEEDASDWVRQMSRGSEFSSDTLTLRMIMLGTDGSVSLDAKLKSFKNGISL